MTTPTNNPGIDLDDYQLIARLIGIIFFAGDFKAETANERELEALLIKTGHRYRSWAEIDALPDRQAAPVAPTNGMRAALEFMLAYESDDAHVLAEIQAAFDQQTGVMDAQEFARCYCARKMKAALASTGAAPVAPATQQAGAAVGTLAHERIPGMSPLSAATTASASQRFDLTDYSQAVNYSNNTRTTIISPASATAPSQETALLGEYAPGQWWLKELADISILAEPTPDQVRAAKVACNFAAAVFAQQGAGQAAHAGAIVSENRDAARYRWLRNHAAGQFEHPIVVSQHHEVGRGMRYMGPVISRELDRLIDAAIATSAQEKKNV